MLPQKILLLYILWLLASDVHAFEWSFTASIVWFVYSWNICILYEWTDSKIQGCYKSLYKAMPCNCIEFIESYQLWYQFYS